MLIVGENLEGLIRQKEICNVNCFDGSCISLSLGTEVLWLQPTDKIKEIRYGQIIPEECIKREELEDNIGLILPPHKAVIASSNEVINMPIGYFGLFQTKSSLARLLVSIHFSDGQIESGFKGKINFEIMNASDLSIRIEKKQIVGNLYIFKASTNNCSAYSGRYQNSCGPQTFEG